MIIVFANQKGGCGKTTNCIQFANYLAELGFQLIVLDLDFQQSISDRRNEDENTYDNKPKYEIIKTEISNVSKLIGDFGSLESGHLLIDLPGKIDDETMFPILQNADIIITPFKYDKLTMDSTGFFIKLLSHLNTKAKLFFMPNNIKAGVRYEGKEQIITILKTLGNVTSEIPARASMERINTLEISTECINVVKDAYDFVIKEGKIN